MSKNILEASLEGAEHIVLLGHIHPDGDCIGTTLGLLNYLRENYPQIEAELFLDHPAAKFSYMNDFEKIHTEIVPEKQFDLCITLDASDKERLGSYAVYFDNAAKTLCIDHHRTNTGFAEQNYIIPDASSCSEVLYTLLDEAKISREAAECLYTGIVHDTGVFKYNSTTRKTMEIAGALMEKGVNAAKIIDDSFTARPTHRTRFSEKRCLAVHGFWMEDVFSVWFPRKKWSFTVSIRTIWMALSISSGLPKEWNVPFSSMKRRSTSTRSAFVPTTMSM